VRQLHIDLLHSLHRHARTTRLKIKSRRFDLITVDGDHTDEGASDVSATVHLLRPGGWLLFDDLVHPLHTLLPVWQRFRDEYAELVECAENPHDHSGTAVARRRDV
jgi:predicted O-methyltransferase YrrM